MEEKLTIKDVCKILGVCYMTLNRYMHSGKITYYKTSDSPTSKVFFLKKDVLKFLNSMKKN